MCLPDRDTKLFAESLTAYKNYAIFEKYFLPI
jgi:hypothetical protein